MNGIKPYPEYKESGVPWLGKVPIHWEVHPNRALFYERNTKNNNNKELLSVTITKGVIRQTDLLSKSSKKDASNEDKSNYKLVKPGDLAYNKMRMWQGAVGASRYEGIVSPAYIIVHPRDEMDEWYYHYFFRTPLYMKESERYSYGICDDQLSLRIDDLKKIFSPKPPINEQKQIVKFLKYKTSQISRFIHAKKRIIDLLEEQKQSIIKQVVTRSLDPNVKLKPSGVEWLGEIPEHWEVSAVRMRYKVQLGKMLDFKRITGSSLVPYLRNQDVQWDQININNLPLMDISFNEYDRYTLKTGDMLVCEGGDVGRSAFWNGGLAICGFQKALHRVRPLNIKKDYPRFLYYIMNCASSIGVFLAEGSENTIAHLTNEKLRAHRFAFPPITEQTSISRFLDKVTSDIFLAITRIEREIALMQEYRTRLIADVVTGKVDVRDIEVPEVTEEELLSEDQIEPEDTEETLEEKEAEE